MPYMTVREVAEHLRVSDLTVRRWIWSGRLPATRLGRMLRINPHDVESLEQRQPPAQNSPESSPLQGTVGALLAVLPEIWTTVDPEDVRELERLIEAGRQPADDTAGTFD